MDARKTITFRTGQFTNRDYEGVRPVERFTKERLRKTNKQKFGCDENCFACRLEKEKEQ